MNRLSIAISPTTFLQLPIVQLNRLYHSQTNLVPIVPRAYYRNKDISVLDNRNPVGVICNYLCNSILDSVETLILTPGMDTLESIKQSIVLTKYALHKGTKIISYLSKPEEEILFDSSNFNVLNYISPVRRIKKEFDKFCESHLSHSFCKNVKIIAVGSTSSFCNQSEVTAKIALELCKRNHKAIAIVSRNDFHCLGCYPVLDNLINNITSSQKAQLIKYYFKYIIDTTECDTLVIEIPGNIYNNFYATAIRELNKINFFICCVPYSKNYYSYGNMQKTLQNQQNLYVNCFHMSNSFETPTGITFLPITKSVALVDSFRTNFINTDLLRIYNLLDQSHFYNFFLYLMDILSE